MNKKISALILLLAAVVLAAPAEAQRRRTKAAPASSKGWPDGPPGSGDPRLRSGMDLWNLGVLGAKAWDADRPEPGPRSSGRRSFSRSGGRGDDSGPARLKIKALFPGGPADKAGLKLDDILVKVGGKSLAKNSLATIAKVLAAAEQGRKKGKVALVVERGGVKVELEARIPKGDKALAKPTRDRGRDLLLRAALDWLKKHQGSNGGFPATLSGNNGAVVMTSLAGLAWLSEGSSLQRGRYRKNLAAALAFVTKGLTARDPFAGRRSTGANWNQTSWAYAHAGIFLGELHAAGPTPAVKRELGRIAKELLARQEVSGGYAHGPGGVNALGYLELNIMAGFVISALGLARKAGCEVDPDAVDRLLAYLKASGSGGGVGYSTKAGQKGRGNIGRTAGAWLGAVALGLGKRDFVKSMGAWTRNHVDDVLGGHATLMQHILLAGVAAKALGGKATARFWKVMERDLVLARAPDGSFQSRPWHESLLMQSNTDVKLGQVWTTASWAVVLGAGKHKNPRAGLPAWTGRKGK